MRLKHKSTYCIGKSYGDIPLFDESKHPLIKGVEAPNKRPGLISFFEDENGKEYCAVVNNTPFACERFMIVLDKNVKTINGARDFYEEKDDVIKVGAWYAPGQMQIYCFE